MKSLKDALPRYRGSFVCSLHFSRSDILMKPVNGKTYVKLKEDAVPKLILNETIKIEVSNDDSAMDM